MNLLGGKSSTELSQKVGKLYKLLQNCILCPRRCGTRRLDNEKGFCGVGLLPLVSSVGPHFGEEPELVGRNGSGTIFFAGCNLGCLFCQNYDISHLKYGDEISPKDLAKEMLTLQRIGCHNVNLVTPTHVVPQIVEALIYAVEKGLDIPIVYNTGGYDSLETIKILDGIIDIYMPDAKYSNPKAAKKYSQAEDYPSVMKDAIREMHRQIGDLVVEKGIAVRGLLVRHLVMPEGLAGTKEIMHFLVKEISKDTYVNIMDQYRPCYRANEFPEINRRITEREYMEAIEMAKAEGLWRGF